MRLFFLRHGEAGMAASDDLRALTPRGEHEATQVALAQRAALSVVEQACVSPILRARQTAQLALQASGLSVPVQMADWLVHETPVQLALAELALLSRPTLLVGHQPLASLLVARLTGESLPIGTGHLIEMEGEAFVPGFMQLIAHHRP